MQAEKLREEIRELQNLRQAQENEMAAIDNAALRNRFQAELDKLILQEQDKKEEVFDCNHFPTFCFLNFFSFFFFNAVQSTCGIMILKLPNCLIQRGTTIS